MIKKYFLAIIVLVLTVILGLVIGNDLPDDVKIPTHWNAHGEADSWAGKTLGLTLLPGISLVMLLFFMFFPWFSPRYSEQAKRFDRILPTLAAILTLILSAMYLLSLMVAGNAEFNGSELLWVIIGILFILLGNLMPKLPSSFFIGIRTPWTLSSEEVWRKTHRTGGKAFVTGGVFFVLAGVIGNFIGLGIILFYIILGLTVIYPIAYSYIAYRKLIKKD